MATTPLRFQFKMEKKLSRVNSVMDIGTNPQRICITHPLLFPLSKSQHVYPVQLMFANNVPGIKIHGDISVLNAQKEVSMILFFRIVERFVRLLITKFKFYLSDTSISQPLHVLVHV